MSKKFLLIIAFLFVALPLSAQVIQYPVISSVSADENSYQLGKPITMTWSRTGNFPAEDSYFVYFKDKSDQVLGSHDSIQGIHYTAVAAWKPIISYPTYTFSPPLVPSGTYYIEIDFVDASGKVLTTATSKGFKITPLQVTIDSTSTTTGVSAVTSTNTPATQITDLNANQKQTLFTLIQAIIEKLKEFVAKLLGQGAN